MQIRFKNHFFKNKEGIAKSIGTFLFLIIIFPSMIGAIITSPAERAEIVGGVLSFTSINPTLNSEFNSNLILSGDPPIANPDTVSVLQGTSVSGNVLSNDSDPDGDVLILNTTPVVAPSNGTVTINTDGTFTYLPYPFFVGTDQFTYELCDGAKVDVIDSYDNQTNVTITPFGTPTVSSTITVTSGGTITDLNIPNFYLEHSWVQDLVITLTSPSGTVVTLVDQACGEDENFDIGFDDESGDIYGDIPCPPDEGGVHQPFEPLSEFDGENSVGDWVLTIYDLEFNDGGFLDYWNLEITSLGAASGTNCVTTTVTALVYSSSTEICSNNIDDDGDGLVDVFDPDCPCDDGNFLGLCDPQCEYTPPGTPSFDIEMEWASEDSVNTFTPVIGADLDGDESSVEILGFKESTTTYVENALFIIDGSNGLTKYTFDSKPLHIFNKGLAFGDADKDGNGEIYYMIGNGDVDDYRRIACYEYNPAGTNLGGTGTGSFDLQWVSDQRVTCGLSYPLYTVTDNYAVNLADFNNDGFPEVYVGNEIFDAITGTRLAAGGANNIGNNIYNFYLHEHFHANPVAVDALPDGDCTNCSGLELVAGNQVYSVDLATGVMTVERELTSAPGHQDGPVSIADYDLDGDVDGIITTTDEDGSYLYIWDLQTESLIGNVHTITDVDISSIWYRSASNATIADFDGDNKPEIGVCANYVFQVIEDYQFDISGTGGVAWSLVTTDRSGMTGATSFDFNADGLTEVVYRDENDLRIISGASGINLSTFPCGSRTGGEYPIVLDIDNDNETELVCSCADESYARNGRMRAFKSQDYPWVPTRNIWNQYAYFITNINDDLSIPPVQQPHHMVGSPALGTTGRLNSFLKQVGPYNNEGEPVFPAADIYLSIIGGGPTECVLGDSIDLNLRFYNLGDLSYPAGIPFAIYEGNPESTGTLVGTFEIPTAIIPGDSVDVSVTLAVAGLTAPFNLFVIGNDDGSLALPLDLENDFPVTSIGECDFSNNIDSITVSDCETEAPVLVGVPDDVTIECDETVSVPTVTATDNCSTGMTVVYSFDENLGSCTGSILRTWTVTDDCGNVATETQTITIQDSEAPTLWGVPSNTTVDCNIQFPDVPNVTATDNCSGVLSITYDSLLTSGDCPYSVTRTWTVTDNCNNSRSESYTIFVLDSIDPVFDGVPSNITVECTEIPEVPNVSVSDNCDNNIELTYEDVYLPNGNYENNDETTVPASGMVWNINISGYAGLQASDFLSFDLSFQSNKGKGRAEFILINPSGQGIFLVGEHCTTGDCEGTGGTLVWSPTFYRCDTGYPQWNNDDLIPPSTGNFIPHGTTPIDPVPGVSEYVTCIEDFTGPMDGQWQLYARKNQTANGLLKFQGFSFNLGNHDCLDEGTIFRTWTATDDCGNTAVTSQTITLEDTTPPLVDAYVVDTTVACYNDIPSIPTLTITDCDDNATITYQGETGSGDCEYDIIRTWLATDNCGNDTLLTQTITVKDTIAPVLDAAPADITISCEDDVPDPAELEATDNCWDEVDVDFSEYLDMDVCPFILRRVWIAIDECDNADSVVQIITIVDDTPPVISNVPDDIDIICTDCINSFLNGDFETPIHPDGDDIGQLAGGNANNWVYWHEDSLGGWETASSDNIIELHASGTNGLISASGNQHAELNADSNSDFYQEFCTIPTTTIQISFAHAKRNKSSNWSDDIMGVYIGPDLNNLTLVETATATEFGVWTYYNLSYAVPIGQTSTIFLFRAIQGSPGNVLEGNCIDDINIITLFDPSLIPTVADNCDNDVQLEIEETEIDGGCENHFQLVRTWTATDDCGNETTATQIITVGDFEPPVFDNLPVDTFINCTEIIPEVPNVTVADNCASDTETTILFDEVVTTGCPYTITRTWVAEDACGNDTIGVQVITIIDTIAPTLVGVPLDVTVECNAIPSVPTVTATDNCSTGMTVVYSFTENLGICNGTIIRTWTAEDDCGNIGIATQTITLQDTGEPSLIGVPADVTINCNDQYPAIPTVTADDDCSQVMSVTYDTLFSSVNCPYTITRTWTATDDCGNIATASQIITLEDTTPPVVEDYLVDTTVVCYSDIPAIPTLNITDCDANATIVYQGETGSGDCEYDIIRTWLATDACGNDTLVTQTITVKDSIAPVLDPAPADITISCEDDIPDPEDLEATDDCWDEVDVDFSEYLDMSVCPFILRRVWIATDECENTDSVVQIITIIDDTPPVMVGIPDDINLDCQECLQGFQNGGFEDNPVTGNWAGVPEGQLPGWDTDASDNKIEIQKSGKINGVVSYAGNWHAELNHINNGDLYQTFCVVPTTILQISFAHRHRPAGGNTSSDIMGVYIGEDLNNLTLVSTIVGERNAGWKIHNISYPVPVGQSEAIFLFRAIQGSPNSISIGNLIDDINIISIPGTTIVPTVTDNCTDDINFELNEIRIENECPNNYQLIRIWTATDDCGNITVDSQSVTVGDFTAPEISGVPQDVTVDCNGIPDMPTVTVTDNCDTDVELIFTEEITGPSCDYEIVRTWIAADDCGNTDSLSQIITVQDTDSPVFGNVPNDVTVECDAIPTAAIVTASDNCDTDVELVFTEEIGTGCPYLITRKWVVTDDCENRDSVIQVITVEDTEVPVFANVPTNITVECDAIPSVATVTASDNCLGNMDFEFSETRTYGCPYFIARVWSATDSCGNETIVSQLITVEDNDIPVLANVPNDVTVDCESIPDAAVVTASDNCIPSLDVVFTEDISTGCPYTITRTWVASDSCNNVVTGIQIITVEDNDIPVLANVPADMTVDCESIPDASIVTVSDNCTTSLQIVFTENISTGCPYIITRTWTATDLCNNVVTETQVITVEDNDEPVLIGMPTDVTVSCSSIPNAASVTASDNCTPNLQVVFSEDISTGCPYTITRTWTATDSCNNVVTGTQIITVEDNNLPVLTGVPSDLTVNCDDILGEALVTAVDDCAGVLPVTFNEVVSTGCPYTITRTW
ncbi:MAG: Ig-like domain-containing protein, partial [Saprospiraceae bacterium]